MEYFLKSKKPGCKSSRTFSQNIVEIDAFSTNIIENFPKIPAKNEGHFRAADPPHPTRQARPPHIAANSLSRPAAMSESAAPKIAFSICGR